MSQVRFLTPVASAKTPPERNSEGACSNKMSVVGTTGLEPVVKCALARSFTAPGRERALVVH